MASNQIYLGIAGMAVITALCRLLPVVVLNRRQLSGLLESFLQLAPVAVIASMVGLSVLTRAGKLDLSLANHPLWLTVPTLLVAMKTRNIALTVVCGVALATLWKMML